ncbi:hypothetical protein MHU86_7893 [Fragilaria crotonensis]|nr:hypothetical protein MHU86_7893 [Fragilaria crotonensis]
MSLAGSKKQRSRALRSHGKVSSVSTGLKNAVGQQSAAATYSPNIPWEFFHDNSPAPTDAPLFLSTPTSSSPPAFADGHALRKRRGRNKKIIQGGEQSSPSSVGDFSKNIEDGYSF